MPKSRYNIAFIPTTKSSTVIQLSQTLSAYAGQYRLGEKSLPHLTLCHFDAVKSELDFIWEEVMKKIKPHTLSLRFDGFDGTGLAGSYWISLAPDKKDELTKMHYAVAEIIRQPLNRSYENYFPHMTLINSHNEQYLEAIKNAELSYVPIIDNFVISLGSSDRVGQYTQVLYCLK